MFRKTIQNIENSRAVNINPNTYQQQQPQIPIYNNVNINTMNNNHTLNLPPSGYNTERY